MNSSRLQGEFQVAPPPWIGPVVMSATGLVLFASFVWYCLLFDFFTVRSAVAPPAAVALLKLLEAAIMLGASGALVYTGYWLRTSRYEGDQGWWVTMWSVLGLIGIPTMIALVEAHQLAQGVRLRQRTMVEGLLIGAGGGSAAGLLIGLSTARSLWHADRVADQRDAFAFLNKLLRHNVLNSVQIVQGNAQRLDEEIDRDREPRLESIIERGDAIADLTQDVRSLAQALSGTGELEPVDLAAVLRRRIEHVRSTYDEVEIAAELPSEVTVRANEGLGTVLDNVLINAVEHNDAETPRVEVTVEPADDGDDVLVHVADNGPGIPAGERAAIFEPKERGDHGVGLYLVDKLVTMYGGDVRVEDNTPRGSVFTVRLESADAPE